MVTRQSFEALLCLTSQGGYENMLVSSKCSHLFCEELLAALFPNRLLDGTCRSRRRAQHRLGYPGALQLLPEIRYAHSVPA
jgi:hypothetical protein